MANKKRQSIALSLLVAVLDLKYEFKLLGDRSLNNRWQKEAKGDRSNS
jgi:hypothetical protein